MTLENSKYYPRAIVLFFSGRWYRTRHIGSTWISLQRPPPLPPSLPPSPPPVYRPLRSFPVTCTRSRFIGQPLLFLGLACLLLMLMLLQ